MQEGSSRVLPREHGYVNMQAPAQMDCPIQMSKVAVKMSLVYALQASQAPFIGILDGGGARACRWLLELGPPCWTSGFPDWEYPVPRISSAMMSLEIWSDVNTRVSNWAGVLPCKPRRLGIWALGP